MPDTSRVSGDRPRSALIVGAGVFGLSAAVALRRRGLGVTVVDAGAIPRPEAASVDISKAVRLDYGDDAFYTDLMVEALAGWRAWNDIASCGPLFVRTGIALLTSTEFVPGSYEAASYLQMQARGIGVERLDAEAIARRFPGVRPGAFRDGYLNPTAGVAQAGRVMQWLADQALRAGCRLLPAQPVTGLWAPRGAVEGVRTVDGATLRADRVVLATGAWCPPELCDLSGIVESTGQVVYYLDGVDACPPCLWGADLASSGWFGFPPSRLPGSGDIVKVANHGAGIGGSPGRVADEAKIDTEVERYRGFVARAMPGLAKARLVETRVCHYTDTFDGDFLIDEVPERPGLAVATGGSGHAFKFAPVLGDLVADMLLDGRTHARFGWRRPGIRVDRTGEVARSGR